MIKNITAVLALVIVALGGALIIQKGGQNISQIPANTQLAQVASVDITSGLVGYWNFDNGTASDSSGSGNNGSVSGATAATGKIGGGLSFNGSGQSVNLPGSLPTLGDFTFSAWVYINSIPSGGNSAIWAKDSNNRFLLKDGYQYLSINNLQPNISTPGNTGSWIHIAVVRSGSNATFYRNGSSLGSWSVGSGAVAFGSSKLGTDGYWNFNGIMDDVRLYNKVLNSSQISALVSYNGTTVTPPPPTPTDTTAPVVTIGNISQSSDTRVANTQINWTTNEPSDSYIEYGPSVAYGSNTTRDTVLVTSHSQTISGLSPVTVYNYKISSKDAAGNTGVSTGTFTTNALQSAGDVTPPATPTGLRASAKIASQIDLTWSASTDAVGVTGYKVYRGGIQIATVTTTNYSDTGLNASTAYSYTVVAYDVAGNVSPQSAPASATTPAAPVTGKFSVGQKVSAVNTGTQTGGVRVRSTPDAGVASNTSYPVGTVATVTAAPAGYTNPTVATGFTWWYLTWDATGVKGWSTEDRLAAYVPPVNPITYTITITKTGTGTGTVTGPTSVTAGSPITLKATADSGSKFGIWSGGASSCGTATSCTFTPTANTTATASFVKVIVNVDATPPTQPTNLVATPLSPTQINLTWTASTDNIAVAGYYIYRDGINIANVNPPVTSFSNTTVLPSTTYNYTVAAYDTATSTNISAQSNIAPATTPAAPTVIPTATLTASPASINSGSSATLSWTSANATSCTGTGFTASAVSGSVTVSPTQTTTYTLTCTGAGGTVTKTAAVTVNAVVSGTALPVDTFMDIGENGAAVTSRYGGGSFSIVGSVGTSATGVMNLPGAIKINSTGTSYAGASTKSMVVNNNRPADHILYNTPSYSSNISTGMYMTFTGPGKGDSQIYDAVYMGYNPYSIVQMKDCSTSSYCLWVEVYNGSTQHSGIINGLTFGKTYWVTMLYGNGIAKMEVYDPATWTLVSGGSVSVGNANGTINTIRYGRVDTHGGTSVGQTYFDNILVDYTNGKFPLLPTGGSVVTNPAPTATLTASPASINSGSSATLSWTSANATSCTGTGFTASAVSGSVTVSPTQTTTYTLTCTGAGGTVTKTAAVTVNAVVNPPVGGTTAGIPNSRLAQATWANAGVPGGIPTSVTACDSLAPGATAAQIISAVNGCSNVTTQKVVTLAAGTYNISPIDFGDPGPQNVTLRGAGMGKTILNISAGAAAINAGSYPPWFNSWTNTQNITSGGAQNSTSVTVGSVTGYNIGDTCVIDMTNSGWIQSYGTGGGTTATYNGDSIGKQKNDTNSSNRAQLHQCRVTGVSGNTISFTPALPFALESARTPQISRTPARLGPVRFGIEDMTIKTSGSATHGIFLNGSYASWIKNVELTGWGGFGFYLRWNQNMTLQGNYLHNPNTYAVDHGYGMQLDPTSNSLVIDNIVYDVQSPFLLQGGADTNVIAYNVFAFGKYTNTGYSGEWLQHEMNANHSPFPSYNLFEGNYTGKIQADYYYGPSGWGTIFRNRIPANSSGTNQNRFAISIDANQRYYSVVGNQLGENTAPSSITLALPGVTRTYKQPGALSWIYEVTKDDGYTPNYIYRLGYPYSGNNGTQSGTGVQDANVKSYNASTGEGTIRHGNWDSANDTVLWDSNISDTNLPNSLFLSSKPAWWGSTLAWPPYGPSAPTSVSSDLDKIPAGYRLQHGSNPL